MPVPSFDQIMLPLLNLIPKDGTLTMKEAVQELRVFLHLSSEDAAEKLGSGQSKLYSRTHWAKWYLEKANFIEPTGVRGTFRLTADGKKLLKNSEDEIKTQLEEATAKVAKSSSQRTPRKRHAEIAVEEPLRTPEEEIAQAFSLYQKKLEDDLLAQLKQVDCFVFEEIVLKLMEKMGYGEGTKTKKTRDGGIDGIISEDFLGLDKIYLQAKRWESNKVTDREMREFIGSIATHDGQAITKAVFITTSDFNSAAIKAAKTFLHTKIRLINGQELAALMIRFGLGVQPAVTYELKKLDKDFFTKEDA